MTNLMHRIMNLPAAVHGLGALLAFGGFQVARINLDASYAASQHPVDYATGQTAFSGETVKGYYAHMQELGTLDIYVSTQIIDFAFIAGMFAFALLISTFVARFAAEGTWARKLALGAGLGVMLGATFDAIENLISFVMLANPQGFANWIALPYSGFAAVKFALITLGMALLIAALVALVVQKVRARTA